MTCHSTLSLDRGAQADTRLFAYIETRDGKRYYETGPKSIEMQRLNSSFNKLHGASSLSNVVGLGAMLYYGFVLAEKL